MVPGVDNFKPGVVASPRGPIFVAAGLIEVWALVIKGGHATRSDICVALSSLLDLLLSSVYRASMSQAAISNIDHDEANNDLANECHVIVSALVHSKSLSMPCCLPMLVSMLSLPITHILPRNSPERRSASKLHPRPQKHLDHIPLPFLRRLPVLFPTRDRRPNSRIGNGGRNHPFHHLPPYDDGIVAQSPLSGL